MKEEEKQQIINQIVDDCNGMVDGDQAFWVYDAGYRKPISRAQAFDLVVDVASSGDSMTCPECNGERAVLSDVTGGPDGPIEHFEECGTCGGQGVLEVDINQILDALGYKD